MSFDISDCDFQSFVFVGIWINYKTNERKKCFWGVYDLENMPLPYTFDFNNKIDPKIGFYWVNKKYIKNGWELFNEFKEEIETRDKNGYLRGREFYDKWWLKK